MRSTLMGHCWPGSSTATALMHRSRLPEDRLLYQDLQGLASGQLIDWTHHRYVRTIQGQKQGCGRDVAAALGRTTLTCLAFNTAQVYRLQAGERLASVAIRRLRRLHQCQLGTAPAVIYVAGCYGVFALEELLRLLGTAPRESLLPAVRTPPSSDAPT